MSFQHHQADVDTAPFPAKTSPHLSIKACYTLPAYTHDSMHIGRLCDCTVQCSTQYRHFTSIPPTSASASPTLPGQHSIILGFTLMPKGVLFSPLFFLLQWVSKTKHSSTSAILRTRHSSRCPSMHYGSCCLCNVCRVCLQSDAGSSLR